MIELTNVHKSFDSGGTFAVKDVTMTINEGEFFVLLGSSGCGKSTTLKMINRLIEPTSGKIVVDGLDVMEQDPIELRRNIGYVFQQIGLFPHMTIGDNVAIVPKLTGAPMQKRQERAFELLELVNLKPAEYAHRYPDELSGGQQQRVGVARALAADPSYLLMDEPFGALDALTREVLQQEILQLKERTGKTFAFVTHDLFEALLLADRIAVMHGGEIQQIGTPQELVNSPATNFVSELFSRPAAQLRSFEELRQNG